MWAAGLLVTPRSSKNSPRVLQAKTTQAVHAIPSPRKRKPLNRRQVGAVKARLIEKFGMLSNRELAARVGLTGSDAPGMLSAAMSGNGTRVNRCAIALALGERPSNLWPLHPERQLKDDDAAFQSMQCASPQGVATRSEN